MQFSYLNQIRGSSALQLGSTRGHCQKYIVEEQSRNKFYAYGQGEGKDTVTFEILLVITKLNEIT